MFNLIEMYLARTLLSTTLLSLSVLIGLSGLIKFIDQLRYVGRGSYDMTVAAVYVLLSLPREIELFFPMATLLGGLIGMGMLASTSELTVMQASGMSRLQIISAAMKSALLMVLFVMALGEWVAPITETKAKEIRAQAISGGNLFASDRLTWAKDGDKFVSIGEVVNRDELRDITIYHFSDELTLRHITTAQSARFVGEQWQLKDVSNTSIGEQVGYSKNGAAQWPSTLTPDKLGVAIVKPEALSIVGLFEYIQYLKNNSQDSGRYQLALWRKILQPISVGVMLLLALSFIFGPLRSVTTGARVIMGVLTGFGFFIVNEVFGPLSMVYNLPPAIGAVAPSLLIAFIAVQMLKR
ncbi:LPS export ABC transporter permease LptG [Alteromonas sp. a30]|uniref:LPS export ABC transporter permease LptG n=1 Tax=Alteromonas sp. a30 TaxID=2730917 RepID=UPI00227E68D6|nr:LPS export ABC transporter permease LptG [Alteromonas sp. a30]MCY7296693.1 LPS export ABC transporter permease LptG [Alteromonas sp. a30]